MDLPGIIELARRDDVRLAIRNGKLGVIPASRLSDELRDHLRTHRDAVVLAIKNAPARLVSLAITAGVHEQGLLFTSAEIRKLRRESDLQDSVNCHREELQAHSKARRLLFVHELQKGISQQVPTGGSSLD